MILTDEMKTEVVDGVRIAYEEYGEGDPIILVHGFGASSYSWREVAKSLVAENRVICVNLMGYGQSDKPANESYTLDRQAWLVDRFLSQKEIDSPVLAGHSYGGGVCLALMRLRRQISSLILVDSICYPQKFPFFVRALRNPLLRYGAFHLMPARLNVAMLLNQIYYRPERIKPETINEYVRCIESEGAEKAMIKTAEKLIPQDLQAFTDSYRHISVPTLVIWGEHDIIVPISLGARLSKEIPNAIFKIIPDCGHAPQEELPDASFSVMRDFLNHG